MSKPEFIESKNCYYCGFYCWGEDKNYRTCKKHDFNFEDLEEDDYLVSCKDWRSEKPLKFEFETEVDELGKVHLTKGREQLIYQLWTGAAGKKVKVVIEEITEGGKG